MSESELLSRLEALNFQITPSALQVLENSHISPKEIVKDIQKNWNSTSRIITVKEAVNFMKARLKGGAQGFVSGPMPILVCEEGAKLRGIDMEVAAADAKRWWETGKVPLRPTPLAK